jgi:sugar O-acyltransferase (sialic acid O-acetyltransferase NeuD family)
MSLDGDPMTNALCRRQPVVILGGTGGGAIVSESIRNCAASDVSVELLGYLNDDIATKFVGYPVFGRFEQWRECPAEVKFISAIMKPGEAGTRFARIKSLGIPADRWITIMHPTANVATSVTVGHGTYVGAAAVLEPGTIIGDHCHLRGGCYVSHDVQIGDFVFIGPNSTILGRAKIGEGAHIGANAVCRDSRSVGRYSIVGIGAVVTRDVPEFTVVAGNPAHAMRRFNKQQAENDGRHKIGSPSSNTRT